MSSRKIGKPQKVEISPIISASKLKSVVYCINPSPYNEEKTAKISVPSFFFSLRIRSIRSISLATAMFHGRVGHLVSEQFVGFLRVKSGPQKWKWDSGRNAETSATAGEAR